MKLFFWKKDSTPKGVSGSSQEPKDAEDEWESEFISQDEEDEIESQVTGSPKMTPSEDRQITEEIKKAVEGRTRLVLPIKIWCERNLTPVAWPRILLRVFPIMSEYGYDFTDMQKPNFETKISHDFYLVVRATIIEIYNRDYEEKLRAKL